MIINAFGAGFKSKKVIITDAQFKDLEDNPVELVSAPGAGKIRIPIFTYLKKSFVAGYDAIAELEKLSLAYGSGQDIAVLANGLSPSSMGLNEFLGSNLTDSACLPGFVSGMLAHIGSGGGGWNGVLTVYPNISGVNEPLVLLASAPFTSGNSENTLTATTIYTTLRS